MMVRFLLLCLLCTSTSLIGQNPFDIKKPEPGKTAPTVKKTETKKPEPKPLAVQPVDTPKIVQQVPAKPTGSSLIEMLESQPPPTTSTNIFDIKNPKGKVAKTSTPKNPVSKKEAPVAKEIKPSVPKTIPPVTNKTTDPAAAQNNAKTNIEVSPPVVSREEAEIKELKKEFKSFGTASTNDKGEISKNAWFIIYIFLFLLAAIAINFNRSYPALLLKATYNQNQLRILFKDAFKGNHMLIFGIFYFLFIINAGIFIYQSFRLFHVAPLSLFWAILIVIVVYLIRHMVLYIMGKVFPMEKETMFFNYTIGIHNLTAGLGLMLINILLSFISPETGKMLIFSGLGIIVALYAMRQVRGLLNNIPIIVSRKLHFIIYLCAVEIAPWMILVRYLTT